MTTFAKAIGMSHRAPQRHTSTSVKQLSPEQSGRTWKLAEILTKAVSVFGSKEKAEQWLERPAIGLNQRKPIDLLATRPGLSWLRIFSFELSTASTRDAVTCTARWVRAGRMAIGSSKIRVHME